MKIGDVQDTNIYSQRLSFQKNIPLTYFDAIYNTVMWWHLIPSLEDPHFSCFVFSYLLKNSTY